MSETSVAQNVGTVTFTENNWDERRRTDRVPVELPVRVRPSAAQEPLFEEVCTTVNASRDGLYFTSANQSYTVGMQLLVTFPYSTVPNARNVDFIAQVVRLDQRQDGRTDVAVELVMTVVNKGKVRLFPN